MVFSHSSTSRALLLAADSREFDGDFDGEQIRSLFGAMDFQPGIV
jgi:hypothetical protein